MPAWSACRPRTATATPTCSPRISCSASANRWANRHTGSIDVYTKGRKFIHVDIEPTQIGRVFGPDLGIVSDAKAALEKFIEVASEWKAAGQLPDRAAWNAAVRKRKRTMRRRSDFDNVPIKPQRVYREMNRYFPRDVRYVSTIGLSQIAAAQFLSVNSRATGSIAARPARWAGRSPPRSA